MREVIDHVVWGSQGGINNLGESFLTVVPALWSGNKGEYKGLRKRSHMKMDLSSLNKYPLHVFLQLK